MKGKTTDHVTTTTLHVQTMNIVAFIAQYTTLLHCDIIVQQY